MKAVAEIKQRVIECDGGGIGLGFLVRMSMVGVGCAKRTFVQGNRCSWMDTIYGLGHADFGDCGFWYVSLQQRSRWDRDGSSDELEYDRSRTQEDVDCQSSMGID